MAEALGVLGGGGCYGTAGCGDGQDWMASMSKEERLEEPACLRLKEAAAEVWASNATYLRVLRTRASAHVERCCLSFSDGTGSDDFGFLCPQRIVLTVYILFFAACLWCVGCVARVAQTVASSAYRL